MVVIIYSFNLNISPNMSYGVLEHNIVILQNYMLMILYKDFVIKKCYLCWTLYIIVLYVTVSHKYNCRLILSFGKYLLPRPV